jgi:hypothetical protein
MASRLRMGVPRIQWTSRVNQRNEGAASGWTSERPQTEEAGPMTLRLQNLRFGLRRLRKNVGFCTVAVLTLGGVGAGRVNSEVKTGDENHLFRIQNAFKRAKRARGPGPRMSLDNWARDL